MAAEAKNTIHKISTIMLFWLRRKDKSKISNSFGDKLLFLWFFEKKMEGGRPKTEEVRSRMSEVGCPKLKPGKDERPLVYRLLAMDYYIINEIYT